MYGLPLLPRSISAALRDLTSSRREVRQSALIDLARYANTQHRKAVLDAVGSLLLTDPDAELRATAALVTADADLTELAPELLRALGDSMPRVQQMALLSLAEVVKSASREMRDSVQPFLKSPLPALRYQALVAWHAMLGVEALGDLRSALDDQDEEVRWVACSLIEDQIVRPRPARSGDAPGSLASSRVTHDPALIAALLRNAEDGAWRIRALAASVLCALGESTQLARQLEQLEGPTAPPLAARLMLVTRFGWLKFAPARSFLARHARRGWFEGPLGWPALVALAAMGDESAVSSVVQELSTSSSRRCRRAIEAVRELRLVAAVEAVLALRQRQSSVEDWLIEDTLRVLCGDDALV